MTDNTTNQTDMGALGFLNNGWSADDDTKAETRAELVAVTFLCTTFTIMFIARAMWQICKA